MGLFDKVRQLWARPGAAADPNQPPPASPSTPHDQWTIPGVFFETAGWKLTQSTPESMTWTGDVGGQMTLNHEPLAEQARAWLTDLDLARREFRTLASTVDGGLVSVEPVALKDGRPALEVVFKCRHGRGFSFDSMLSVAEGDTRYVVRISADEGMTGTREALVTAKMVELGEIDITAMMSGPPEPGGSRKVSELQPKDPYDAAFDESATYARSDDERIDPLFPFHPLTSIRAMLKQARTTWQSDAAPENAVSPTRPASAGPRKLVSDDLVRELWWIAGRNDLLEPELTSAIAAAESAGRGAEAATGRLWSMLGLVQHNAGNVLIARTTLRRADELLTAALGDHVETGCALVSLARTEHTLGRFVDAERTARRAVAILERRPGGESHLFRALSYVAQSLAEQNRLAEATPFIARLQSAMPQEGGGLMSLRALTGGPVSGVTARTKVV